MRPRLRLLFVLAVAGVSIGGSGMLQLFPARASGPGATERVSVDSAGAQGDADSWYPSISADGRYVAFSSYAINLVPGDTNAAADVLVRDRLTNTTERVSADGAGAQGDADSWYPSISAAGRYVAFRSGASNLVAGDTNAAQDIFVHDRDMDTMVRVSVGGAEGDGDSWDPSISADGRYVAFQSLASNLVPDDTNGLWDIFVRDRNSDTTGRVSLGIAGMEGNGISGAPSISADGRYVAFISSASNLVAGDTNAFDDVFVRDRDSGTTERVSVDSAELEGNGNGAAPSISSDGRYVAFISSASNLVAGDTNAFDDVFVRDRDLGTTERASVDSAEVEGNTTSGAPSISAVGRYVAFESFASNLVPGDTNGAPDAFVRDRTTGTTERVSIDSAGAEGNTNSWYPSLSADGRYVAFSSYAINLVAGDTNGTWDVFVRDRVAWVAVGGIAERPDATALPSAGAPSGRNYMVYIVGAAVALVVATAGAAGWRKRRA